MEKKNLIFLALISLLVMFPLSCREADGPKTTAPSIQVGDASSSTGESPLPSAVALENPYSGEPFGWINGFPVPAEQIDRYAAVFVSTQHQFSPHSSPAETNIFQQFDSFARYFVVIQEGVRLGLEEEEAVRRPVDVFRLAALGDDYLRDQERNAPIDPEELKTSIPEKWVRMNFEIKLLPPGLDPGAAEAPRTVEEWEKLEFSSVKGDGLPSQTGLVFPGSGYFEPEVDAFLFGLEEGDMEGPVPTGIGYAFVRVREKDVFGEDEINRYMEDLRSRFSRQYATSLVQGALEEITGKVDEKAFAEGLEEEVDSGELTDVPVFSWQGIEVTYRNFREQTATQYSVKASLRLYPSHIVLRQLRTVLDSFLARLALGRKGEETGLVLDDKWRKAVYDYHLRQVFNRTLEVLEDQYRGDTLYPNEEEVRRFYEERKFSRYVVPAEALVTYLRSPDRSQLEGFYDRILTGSLNLDSIPEEEMMRTPHQKQVVRRVRVTETGGPLGEIRQAVLAMDVGNHQLIQTESAFYLVRVNSKRDRKIIPFEEISDRVESDLYRLRWATAMNDRLAELYGGADIRLNRAAPPEEGIPADEFRDRS